MRCVVPSCNVDCNTKDLTFVSFPTKTSFHAEWLKVLKMDPLQPVEDSIVCSKHFLKGDVYVNPNGVSKLRTGALPVVNLQSEPMTDASDVKIICRICFATDCKLYKMMEYNKLSEAYTMLTGLTLENDVVPPYMCSECSQRLLNCVKFKTRSLRAHLILLEVAKKHEYITLQSIKSVIGDEGPIGTQLKVTQTDHHHHIPIKCVKEENDERVDLTDNVDIKIEMDDAIDTNYSTAADHVEYLPELNEDYEIKIDTNDYINRDAEENVADDNNSIIEDLTKPHDEIIYMSRAKKDATNDCFSKDVVAKDVVVNVSVINTAVCDDSVNKDTVEKDVDVSNEKEDILLMVKKRNKVKNVSSKGKSARYLLRDSYYMLADKMIVKPGSTTAKVRPVESCPTNIVKLRKRIAGDKSATLYDKLPYQTVSDVPLWGRLKSHTAIKPFSCRMCSFKTGYKKELKLHEKTHCEEASQSYLRCNSEQSGDKTVACDVCKEVFLNKTHLYKHIKISSGWKPYSCDICKKQFKLNYDFQLHSRTHTGEKPYSCNVCKKKFNFETSLALHSRRLHPDEGMKKLNKYIS